MPHIKCILHLCKKPNRISDVCLQHQQFTKAIKEVKTAECEYQLQRDSCYLFIKSYSLNIIKSLDEVFYNFNQYKVEKKN